MRWGPADPASGDAEHPLTVVVCALREEMEAFVRRLDPPGGWRPATPGLDPRVRVRFGRLAGRRVVVAATGDGERNARLGVSELLNALPVARLVIAGVSGGLSPRLAPGSIVVGERVVNDARGANGASGELVPSEVSPAWVAGAAGGEPGRVVTSRTLACTPEDKAALYARFGDSGKDGAVAVVDLESAFYAAAAQEAGVPWTVVRTVSDTASERLPEFLEDCRDAGGAVRRWAVLCHALRHPFAIGALLRIRHQVRRCASGLAVAVERVLDAERTE
ncbi:MAG: hypothetical protein ACE5HQ_07110 [Gemmatimonadota bacterium]